MILRENFHENKKGQYMNALISVISIILFIVLGIIIYNGLNGMDLKKKIITHTLHFGMPRPDSFSVLLSTPQVL